ncbi:MAG: carboxypeptidase regulatory-like domain-containing protein [Xanthomonadales bacterium]|nr:carboxypeptidase regulatory-like domain-containing protein [Xanthomonadales bacterium]
MLASSHIEGTITHVGSGLPLSGVRVELYSVEFFFGFRLVPHPTQPFFVSDENGHYIFSEITPGNWAVRAEPAPPLLPEFWPNYPCITYESSCGFLSLGNYAQVHVEDGQTTVADFALAPPGRIEGTVISTDSTPISGASVHAGGETTSSWTLSDELGHFAIEGVAEGAYTLTARGAEGYLESDPVWPVVVLPEQTTDGVVITMTPAASISGTIHEQGLQTTQFFMRLMAEMSPADPSEPRWQVQLPLSAGSGSFSFDRLPAGTYYIYTDGGASYRDSLYESVDCPGYSCEPDELHLGTPITVAAGESVTGIDLSMIPSGSISGCVRAAADDAPLEGVHLTSYFTALIPPGNTIHVDSRDAVTGADGCYEVTHVATGSQIQLSAVSEAGHWIQTRSGLSVFDDTHLNDINFSLVQGGGILGRILDRPGGSPVLARVGVSWEDGALYEPGRNFERFLNSDENGNFGTFGLQDGVYRLTFDLDPDSIGPTLCYRDDPIRPLAPVGSSPDACTSIQISGGIPVRDLAVFLEPGLILRADFESIEP